MPTITIEPATADRVTDAEHTFTGGGDGAVCQCQWWTITNAEYQRISARERGELLREEIEAGPPPALIAYVDGVSAGWVRVGPRASLRRLVRTKEIASATAEPLDDPSVWSVSCFVVRREFRTRGLMPRLLDAAVGYARAGAARVIEAYPIDTALTKHSRPDELFRGVLSVFISAGFTEVARPKPDRAIVSLML